MAASAGAAAAAAAVEGGGCAAAAAASAGFDPARRQVFVVGNEAADADSLVSAYATAALLDAAAGAQGLAVAQIPREEFRLRGDALALFRQAGSEVLQDGSPAQMKFWDEVDWQAVRSLPGCTVVLTDHNKMSQPVEEIFEGRVEWILDHHSNSKAYPEVKAEIDESLGSACTLVAEQFLQRAGGDGVSKEVATLLAGVILLDNRNFNPEERKGTQRDRDAFDGLAALLPAFEQKAWYQDLMEARKDVSHLSLRELLLLDLKIPTDASGKKIAFSSVFSTLRSLVEKVGGPEAVVTEMQAFASRRGCDLVVGMFDKDSDGFKAMVIVSREPGPVGEALSAELLERLHSAPEGFPQELRDNPLYSVQGILEHGFGLAMQEDLKPLPAYKIRGAVTRKTVLPCAIGPVSSA